MKKITCRCKYFINALCSTKQQQEEKLKCFSLLSIFIGSIGSDSILRRIIHIPSGSPCLCLHKSMDAECGNDLNPRSHTHNELLTIGSSHCSFEHDLVGSVHSLSKLSCWDPLKLLSGWRSRICDWNHRCNRFRLDTVRHNNEGRFHNVRLTLKLTREFFLISIPILVRELWCSQP